MAESRLRNAIYEIESVSFHISSDRGQISRYLEWCLTTKQGGESFLGRTRGEVIAILTRDSRGREFDRHQLQVSNNHLGLHLGRDPFIIEGIGNSEDPVAKSLQRRIGSLREYIAIALDSRISVYS